MTGSLCRGSLFYLFPLISGERGRKRKGERQTDKQREEKRESGWRQWQRHRIKIKNKGNDLSRKNGSMNSLHAKKKKKKKTANSRCIEILLWREKWIIDAFFSFFTPFRYFHARIRRVYERRRRVVTIYLWTWAHRKDVAQCGSCH